MKNYSKMTIDEIMEEFDKSREVQREQLKKEMSKKKWLRPTIYQGGSCSPK